MPQSLQLSIYNTLTQFNRIEGKVKSVQRYRNKKFLEILAYFKTNNTIDDIILAGDLDQDIRLKEVQQFFADLGIQDIHHKINNILLKEIDNTYIS